MPKSRLVLSAAFALFAIVATAVPAAASGPATHRAGGSWQQVLINQDRAAAHERGLAYSSCLASFAHAQAAAMAARESIYHSSIRRDFSCRLGSRFVGENVGVLDTGGATFTQAVRESALNTTFMNSPGHRANILLGAFHYVGTAWVHSGTRWYVAVEFG